MPGRPEAKVLKDKWTAVTKDGSNSAHFEHCVAVTDERAVGADEAVRWTAGGRPAGLVVEVLPSAMYPVELENAATGSGPRWRARQNGILSGCGPGDRVEVELSPHDPTRGRIRGR